MSDLNNLRLDPKPVGSKIDRDKLYLDELISKLDSHIEKTSLFKNYGYEFRYNVLGSPISPFKDIIEIYCRTLDPLKKVDFAEKLWYYTRLKVEDEIYKCIGTFPQPKPNQAYNPLFFMVLDLETSNSSIQVHLDHDIERWDWYLKKRSPDFKKRSGRVFYAPRERKMSFEEFVIDRSQDNQAGYYNTKNDLFQMVTSDLDEAMYNFKVMGYVEVEPQYFLQHENK